MIVTLPGSGSLHSWSAAWPAAGELHRTNWWLTGLLVALLLAVVAVVIWLIRRDRRR